MKNMKSPQAVKESIVEWARDAFAHEVNTGFSRAQTFDGFLSRLVLSAVHDFHEERLRVLSQILPTGAGSSGPTGTKVFNQLSLPEKQVVEEFRRAVQEAKTAKSSEHSDYITKPQQIEVMNEAERIRKMGVLVVKEIAFKWGYENARIEEALWSLSCAKSWGKFSVQFDLETELELRYGIFVYDSAGNRLRWHDHYLGVLGLAPSSWAIKSVDECQDKMLKASEFIHWHVCEYERIIANL